MTRIFRSGRFGWGLFAVVIVAAAVFVVQRWRDQQAKREHAPAAYVLPADGPVRAKIGWRNRNVSHVLALGVGSRVRLPDGAHVLVIRPDGSIERLQGPTDFEVPPAPSRGPEFLTLPLEQLLRPASAPESKRLPPVVTSPVGLTRFRNPIITWIAAPGTDYDVAIVDPADDLAPPRIRRNVTSPVAATALETTQTPELPADRILAVAVRESARPSIAAVARFLTTRDATVSDLPEAPAQLIVEAVEALRAPPLRIGDAWLALARLPPEWTRNELVARLRLQAAAELGLVEQRTAWQNEARTLMQ